MSDSHHKSSDAAPVFAGIDLGGTNIKVALVDDSGEMLDHESIPTLAEKGPEEGARRMGQAVLRLVEKAGIPRDSVVRLGLATPGTMDIPAGMLLDPPNLPGWNDFPIRDRVAHHAALPVSFVNDAAAAAYGEYWVGRGRELNSMVLLTLGTGVGGGIILGDSVLEGENSHGAECGHIIIDYHDDARMCPCGHRGHLEAYASAKALVKRTEEALASDARTSVRARLDAGEELTPLLLSEEAEAGDTFSLALVLETAMYLGVGIVSLMHTIDPSGIILGGAMTFGGGASPVGRAFLDRVGQEIHNRAFPALLERTTLDYAALGGNAGCIGAAGVARRDARHREKATGKRN